MAAKRSKKRKVHGANVDDFETKPTKKVANEPGAGTAGASNAPDEMAALESRIERLHSGLDAARGVLWASRFVPELDAEALERMVDYAHRTCYIAAPHGFVPGESQLFMMRPPAPQTVQFQQSILHQLAASAAGKDLELYNAAGGVGAGDRAAGAAAVVSSAEQTAIKKDSRQEKRPVEAAKAASKQATDKVDMVEVLKRMPEMPVGWKLGDPIPGSASPTKPIAAGNGGKPPTTVQDVANTDRSQAQPAKKPMGLALGLEVDDLDFGLGSSSSSAEDSD